MKLQELTTLNIGEQFVNAWRDRGIEDLTEIQDLALSDLWLRNGGNAIIIAPTSAGKTFIGEVLAVRTASSLHRAIYLVPYKALAEEKYIEFSEAYRNLGISVVVSSGDYAEFDVDIRRGDFGIAIIVYEKLVQLLVQAPGIISDCHTLIVDEVQLIRDKERGPLLEMLLTRVKRLQPAPQIVCLSATVSDLGGFDSWLGAKVIETRNRPVPLWEGVLENAGTVVLHNVATNQAQDRKFAIPSTATAKEDILVALVKNLGPEEQMLIFRSQVDETEKTATRLAQHVSSQAVLRSVREKILALEDSLMRSFLERHMDRRIAFHNAGLSVEERRLVEELFREGFLRVVVTTATLAAGVNLPADFVVIADYRRYNFNAGTRLPIDVAEYKNCAGRAGRYGKRSSGISLLLAEFSGQTQMLEKNYIYGNAPKLESAIPMQRELARHVLAAIAQRLGNTETDIVTLFSDSFAFVTFYKPNTEEAQLVEAIQAAINRLLELGLVEERDSRLSVTPLGRVAARSGVSLATFGKLEELARDGSLERQDSYNILARITGVEEMERLRPFSATQRAELLAAWVGGESAGVLSARFSSRYSVGHGRIRDLGEVAEWLLSTTAQIATILRLPEGTCNKLSQLSCESHFGLPAELVELARLRVLPRSDLLRLIRNDKGVKLVDPHRILDAEPKEFTGILPLNKVASLKECIARSIGESLKRRKVGHLLRCDRLAAIRPLVERVYDAHGTDFDRALEDLLNAPVIEIGARRFTRQGRGEADLEVVGRRGTIVISVTASEDDQKPISWNKSREVLGSVGYTGAASNFVVIGKPDFHHMAIDNAKEVSDKEDHLLLIPLHAFVELCLQKVEGKLTKDDLISKLEDSRGYFIREALEVVDMAGA